MLENILKRYQRIQDAHFVLGLDLGISSVGWAVADTQQQKIIKSGVIIFKSGSTQENQDRRQKRGARRNNQRFKKRRTQLIHLCEKHLTDGRKVTPSPYVWNWRVDALSKPIALQKLATILLHFNRHRGFQSNRRTDKGDSASNMKKVIKQTRQKLIERNQTLSQYYCDLMKNKKRKIRANFAENDLCPDRAMYRDELEKIWQTQAQFYPEILTKTLYQKIFEETIFFQRSFLQNKGKRNVGKCPYFPNKDRAPIFSIEYQESRILQIINNLRLTDHRNGVSDEPLTKEVWKYIYDKMMFQTPKKIKVSEIISLMREHKDCFKDAVLNYDKKQSFDGHKIGYELAQIFGHKKAQKLIREYYEKGNLSLVHRLVHALRSCPFTDNDQAEKWLMKYAQNTLKLTPEEAQKFALINPDIGYGNMSTAALQLILPHLRHGDIYSEACEKAGLNHTEQTTNEELNEQIEPIGTQEIMNATVKKAINQMISLVNRLKKDPDIPPIDAVVLEMMRELKMSEEKRNKLTKQYQAKKSRREEYQDILKNIGVKESNQNIKKYELWLELGMQDMKDLNIYDLKNFTDFSKKIQPKDLHKYQLWKEAKRICPYTGQVIALSDLFNTRLVDVEHIYPRSKTLDDSFMNKTITLRTANAQKSNMLPLEYFSATGGDVSAFKRRIKHFPKKKRERFLAKEIPEGFVAGNYVDTAYITKVALEKLQTVFPDVIATNGAVTANLRYAWKLHKSRETTLLHHAMDAMVIAFTSRNIINAMSTISALGGKPFEDTHAGWKKPPFHGFAEYVEQELNKITVVRTDRKRLTNRKLDKKDKTPKYKIGVRGALHKETLYGIKTITATNKEGEAVEKTVSTKRISVFNDNNKVISATDIQKILSDDVRQSVIQWAEERKNAPKETPETAEKKTENKSNHFPVHIKTGNTIKKVRINAGLIPDNLLEIRKENPETGQNTHFVTTANIYMAGIYQTSKGKLKRKLFSISLHEAVQRQRNNMPLLPDHYPQNPDYRLCLTVSKNDLFLFDDEKYQGVYRVLSFDGDSIIFAHHTKPIAKKDFKRSVNKLTATPVEVDILGNITERSYWF